MMIRNINTCFIHLTSPYVSSTRSSFRMENFHYLISLNDPHATCSWNESFADLCMNAVITEVKCAIRKTIVQYSIFKDTYPLLT